MTKKRRAVFLDRDGVVNVDKGYVHLVEDLELLPGVPEAIRLLKGAGFLVIVVTNQSGVGRGFYTLDDVNRLHRHLDALLAAHGAAIDAYYVCPHHPEHGQAPYRVDCNCRKPLPGMLVAAAADWTVDLSRSFMVGDKMSDVAAGVAAGCRSLLVGSRDTGAGVEVYADLLEAVREILAGRGIAPGNAGPATDAR